MSKNSQSVTVVFCFCFFFSSSSDRPQIFLNESNRSVWAQMTREKFRERERFSNVDWPPFSPNLKSIENLWNVLEKTLQWAPKRREDFFIYFFCSVILAMFLIRMWVKWRHTDGLEPATLWIGNKLPFHWTSAFLGLILTRTSLWKVWYFTDLIKRRVIFSWPQKLFSCCHWIVLMVPFPVHISGCSAVWASLPGERTDNSLDGLTAV